MAYVLLGLAIAAEVAATLAMRGSQGLTQLGPTIGVITGYVVSFILMARALQTLEVGPVYAIWSGVGTVGVFAGGCLLFGEPLRATTIIGAATIVVGVIVMNLGSGTGNA